MNRTKIEYLNYCWNFYPGCQNGCSYCWAHTRAIRFNNGDFEPRLRPQLLLDPLKLRKFGRIGVCFTGDLFGDWVNPNMAIESWLPSGIGTVKMSLKGWVFTTITKCPQHTFIFLTKQPQNLAKWSPFPENCWVGVSVDGIKSEPFLDFAHVRAGKTFVSFEPLLAPVTQHLHLIHNLGLDWVIVGACTPYSPKTAPKVEWVREIVEACDKAGVKVFLKNNLLPVLRPNRNKGVFFQDETRLRQEFPDASPIAKEQMMCKHDWFEKPDYNERFCGKGGKTEMIVTRKELLAMSIEERRKILAKQSADFVKSNPDYFKDLL